MSYKHRFMSVPLIVIPVAIAALLTFFFVLMIILSRCLGTKFELSGAIFSMLFHMAVCFPFFFSSRAITIYIRSRMKGMLGFLVSLSCTVLFCTAVGYAFSVLTPLMQPDFPEEGPNNGMPICFGRLLAVINITIAGGFLMGLACRPKDSAESLRPA
ncbi:MAG: hypothetical protein AB9903_25955 [Vulcanimicrobiota bacterium]